ncbi:MULTISPECIES: hypothetical protein [unclassified Okeania]|uniref:hypothetical protein n=1 Tax=unclassified Okeania TaxID=2634635 RepID=UPI0025809474|nr:MULTISPECIES: hypothetical protein [unclassified Okeania]
MRHPFDNDLETLESLQKSQVEPKRNTPNDPSQGIATTLATGEEGGATTEAFDDSENGGELIATTLELGEEGGTSEAIATTLAIGEEGGNLPVPTTLALGEEGGLTPIGMLPRELTTEAVGEEGGFATPIKNEILTQPSSEEGFATTQAIGEEGGMTPIGVPPGEATTQAIGEEGGFATPIKNEILTQPGSEEGFATTQAVGEEGGVTTLAVGEEGGVTTLAIGEEGGFATPINNGTFTQVGSEEGGVTTLAIGEEGGDFNEEIYRQSYPGIDVAINRGEFSSGLEHYIQFGQFEIERIGFFTDNDSNDIINAFGNNTRIVGVSVIGYDLINDRVIPSDLGTGEIDILVGSSGIEGVDQFILGSSQGSPFYLGFGDSDFALIQNFDTPLDQIKLSGTLNDYSFEIVNDSVNISTLSGDLIAIIEGVSSLDNLNLNFI